MFCHISAARLTHKACPRYVSKHADYTFHYMYNREPREGDRGSVIMLETVTGKVSHAARVGHAFKRHSDFR